MRIILKGVAVAALAVLFTAAAAADDGAMFRRNVSKTPDLETDHATMKMMKFYVPAQSSDGSVGVPIDYYDANGALVETKEYAKPLIAFYHDGEVIHVPDTGFPGHGKRDVYGAVSLDDGATWKRQNLSRTGDLSSFTLSDGTEYPGDTFRLAAAVAGDRVMVAWASRYCQGASPLYSWEQADQLQLAADYELGTKIIIDGIEYSTYASDLFGVVGTQKSIDFADEDYPTVGEVPYACLWAARGELLLDEDAGTYGLEWIKPERITSGVRDVHRIEVHAVKGAGFVVTWQEDPDGLRPGKGLGPGAGWSGAIAHQKTEIWYSHLAWNDFDLVCIDDPNPGLCTSGILSEVNLDEQPQVAVPMAMPVRISDNDFCKWGVDPANSGYVPYCYADFDENGTADLCAEEVPWTNPGGTTLNLCQTEDGRVSTGQNASTRARVKLQPYTLADGSKSAWVMLAYEEMKGLGVPPADPNDPEPDPIDIGKDVWYHSFDMFTPDYAAQGAMLNPPAVDPETGTFFEFIVDEWGNEYYETEISRRASLIAQPADNAGDSGVVALVLWKQGIINQGGPADIFGRYFVIPEPFDSTVDNPYSAENMVCAELDDQGIATPVELLYPDGINPNYVEGLCPATAFNLSGTTIVSCDDGSEGQACAAAFPWPTEDGDPDPAEFPKVTEWEQTEENFNDYSWVNPYDVAKGHRGFIDGDFIMMMYGWSPNWKATSLGQDAYNLYVRRSFDGGATWTTLPANYTHVDGTTWNGDGTYHCEWYGAGGTEEYDECTSYGAGEFEQARNLTQFVGSKITLLDPRFASTKGDTGGCIDGAGNQCTTSYDDDIRDPSVFMVSYQTGDNTTVEESEATPLDMFYSQASEWGDEYYLVDVLLSDGTIDQRFDWIENKKNIHSAEASLATNPAGTFLYAVWNQWRENPQGIPYESDAFFRRIWFDPDADGGGSSGGSGGGGGGGGRP